MAIPELRPRGFRAPDISAQRFGVARRGYDPSEVHAYLQLVAAEVERLQQELQRQRAQAEILEHRSRAAADTAYSEVSRRMVGVMQSAESAAARVRSEAEADCGRVLADAREEAARSLEEARREAARLVTEAGAEAERLLTESRHQIWERVEAATRHPSFRAAPREPFDPFAPSGGATPVAPVAHIPARRPAPVPVRSEPPDPEDFDLRLDLFGDPEPGP